MSLLTEAIDALHTAEAKFALLGHGAATKVRAIITEVDADALTLGQKAWADVQQAEADAKAAAAPVVAEVEADAKDLAAEAKADVEQVITDAKS